MSTDVKRVTVTFCRSSPGSHGAKITVLAGLAPSGGSGENPSPGPSQLPEAAVLLGMGPSRIPTARDIRLSPCCLPVLWFLLLPPPPVLRTLVIILAQIISAFQNTLISHLIPPATSTPLCCVRCCAHGFWGLGRGHSEGALFWPVQTAL